MKIMLINNEREILYLFTFNNSSKLFCCASTKLKEKAKDLFDLSSRFLFQMFDEDFNA